MADRGLDLEAKVKDSATPTLRRIKSAIANLKKTPGMEGLGKQLENVTNQVQRFSKGGSEAVLATGSLGLAALAAGGSIVALGAKFRALALHANSLKEISRETGLTINQLNQLQQVAPRFGVNADQITKAMETWADKMVDVRRGWGDVVSQLNGQGLGDFVKKLQRDNPAQAVHDIFALLGSDKLMANPALQKRWTAMFLGDGGLVSLFQKGGKGIEQAWSKTAANLDPINKNLVKNANAMRNALADLNIQISNLENVVAPPIFKLMAKSLDDAARATKRLVVDLKPLMPLLTNPNKAVDTFLTGQQKEEAKSGANVNSAAILKGLYDGAVAGTQNLIKGAKPVTPFTSPGIPRGPSMWSAHRFSPLNFSGVHRWPSPASKSPLLHHDAFRGPTAGLRQNIAYRPGAGLGAGGRMFERAVETGVLRGLIDFENRTALGAPSLTRTSYEPGGGGGAFGIRRGAGGGGGGFGIRRGTGAHGGSDGAGADIGHFTGKGHAVGGSADSRAMYAMNRLVKKWGFSPASAAAFVGGDMQESSLNPKIVGDPSVPGGSHGLAQWNRGRLARLKAFGGAKWNTMDPQIDFKAKEVMKQNPQWAHQKDLSRDLAIEKAYEGFKAGYAGKRGVYAQQFFRDYQAHGEAEAKKDSKPGSLTGFKLPKGGYWATDAEGRRVPVGPTGQSLGRDGKPVPDILGLAAKAGVLHHTIHHDGGADVRVRFEGAPPIRGVSSATSGMVRSIQVNRGTSMMETREV